MSRRTTGKFSLIFIALIFILFIYVIHLFNSTLNRMQSLENDLLTQYSSFMQSGLNLDDQKALISELRQHDYMKFTDSIRHSLGDLLHHLESRKIPADSFRNHMITVSYVKLLTEIKKYTLSMTTSMRFLLWSSAILMGIFLFILHFQSNQLRLMERSAVHEKELNSLKQTIHKRETFRISRELHDGIAQNLAYARILTDQLSDAGSGPEQKRLKEVIALTITEVRSLARDLRDRNYEEDDLSTHMIRTLEELEGRYRMHIHSTIEDISSYCIDGETVENLIRIITETIANIVRHSGQKEAYVRLWRNDENKLALEVRDRGKGLLEPPSGLGSQGIKERAELIDARVCWTSPESGGTRFHLLMPLKEV